LVKPAGAAWTTFENALAFGAADPDDPSPMVATVTAAEKALAAISGKAPRRLFHLAVPPAACASVIEMLGATNLSEEAHVIVEKPFGTDLASARALNQRIHAVFDESQIFRIDHFLGKESVDNVLALRFANGFFEPVWNRDHISHVQIDVPEKISIEGRADFFEKTGAFRDMIVTHLFQVLGFVAMEPPNNLSAKSIRDETCKVFEAMRLVDVNDVVRGQYDGYRSEKDVDPSSQTETFVALKVEIDNWRWAGVPFYLRSGKSMGQRRQLIALGFRKPTLQMFPNGTHRARPGNQLVIDFDDPGWISLQFQAKQPGPEMELGSAEMSFQYENSFRKKHDLEGYEHLILEAMRGNQALFTRSDGIERLWEVAMPLIDDPPPVDFYQPGSWGPESIKQLIAPHHWYLPDGRD
jgi:glucose-6-phosphate 1-dehydrogenase